MKINTTLGAALIGCMVIAGIGWIGTSFYFIALDQSLKRREKMKEGVLHEVDKYFKPEFLNRLDDIIVFRPLTKLNLKSITRHPRQIRGPLHGSKRVRRPPIALSPSSSLSTSTVIPIASRLIGHRSRVPAVSYITASPPPAH